MEDLIINPNIAYLLLVIGFILAGLAIINPGTGVLEIAAIFILLLAGWEVYILGVNLWALVVMLLGIVPFFLAVRRRGNRYLLALSFAALVIGSWFLFPTENWWQTAINPLLFIVVSALTIGFLWLVTVKVVEAESIRPTHDLDGLIGQIGETRTNLRNEGSVQVAGELWTARSQEPIPQNRPVRVIGREGFILLVEAASEAGNSTGNI
jgi:membrane-bound serine protease (ClpP class)